MGTQDFYTSTNHLKIIGARSLKWCKFENDTPQILGPTTEKCSHHGDPPHSICVPFICTYHCEILVNEGENIISISISTLNSSENVS